MSERFDGYIKGKVKGKPYCDCHKCSAENNRFIDYVVLCDICGNKRCPRASNHALKCTHSNEPGQEGSIYAAY